MSIILKQHKGRNKQAERYRLCPNGQQEVVNPLCLFVLVTFSGFCSCPLAGFGLDEDPPQPVVCTAFSSCQARRASRSLCSSRQIQSGCKNEHTKQRRFLEFGRET